MGQISRRRLLGGSAAATILNAIDAASADDDRPARGNIASIEHRGVLISECTVPGEQRRDDVTPAHPNGIRVSRDRWVLVYATRGFRGVDDDRSIVYQLRAGSPEGRALQERMLVSTRDDWDPLGEGKRYVKQHGHPVLFGVPRGARIGGKPAPSANVFVLKWRQVARVLDPERKMLVRGKEDEEIRNRTQAVGWLQFRLNDREDGIEILQPATTMRQKGFAAGPAFSSAAGVSWINQTYTQAVPFNADATEWADCNHFDNGRVAALKYSFNPDRGLYEWTETGPFLFGAFQPVTEASLARLPDGWAAAARMERRGVLWARTENPFTSAGRAVWCERPASPTPRTAYACPDGVLRLLTGDPSLSPHGNQRDPLYLWDVDPGDEFRASQPRVIYDSVRAGLPIRKGASPMVDMAKLLPHSGREQYVLHRVTVRSYNHPYTGSNGAVMPEIPVINAEEKGCCGVYCARITYREAYPGLWEL